MHLVTSSLFLSSIFSLLTRRSQKLLLRGYFAICLVWYVGQGCAELDIARFFGNAATLLPIPPGPKPSPHKDVCPSPTSRFALTPDPWLHIIQSTLTHPDDHLPKLQRTLAEYSSHFGSTPTGYFTGTELKDAELIDGTLFVRSAGLTCGRLGWVREGEPPLETWDIKGFFKVMDEIWNIGKWERNWPTMTPVMLVYTITAHHWLSSWNSYRTHNIFLTFETLRMSLLLWSSNGLEKQIKIGAGIIPDPHIDRDPPFDHFEYLCQIWPRADEAQNL